MVSGIGWRVDATPAHRLICCMGGAGGCVDATPTGHGVGWWGRVGGGDQDPTSGMGSNQCLVYRGEFSSWTEGYS